ncbi:Sigma-24 [Kingella potus]|uniref:Sigma-24 n=1 Tax=Kingella potus TaxID=265175 RepID=A0A377R028_9NEIS|nr:sigma-70 family RNA polymerase sigma factor [Kingella potus]UOP00943.1 sigma-70 family RNA polymerase sigma factor [Kingella potus]STR00602.1 Sigma-24 [Kingella potus]
MTAAWDDAALAELHPHLLRFARIQTGDDTIAEDLTQETLLAAVRHRDQYAGEASLKTWLFAILKNKITDHLRRKQRHNTLFAETPAELTLDELYESQFQADGHWLPDAIPATPEQDLENRQFQAVFQACLYNLPENTARVFMLREVMDWEAAEIQACCGITAANYYTIMHRAREALRQCLQTKWFNHQEQEQP